MHFETKFNLGQGVWIVSNPDTVDVKISGPYLIIELSMSIQEIGKLNITYILSKEFDREYCREDQIFTSYEEALIIGKRILFTELGEYKLRSGDVATIDTVDLTNQRLIGTIHYANNQKLSAWSLDGRASSVKNRCDIMKKIS